MWWFVLTFICGMAVGRRAWLPTALLRRMHYLITACLAFLIFVLGYALGSNRSLVHSLPLLGYRAFVIALLSMGGSVMFGMLSARWLWRDSNRTAIHHTNPELVDKTDEHGVDEGAEDKKRSAALLLPTLILLMLLCGGILGWMTSGKMTIGGLWQNTAFAIMLGGIGVEIGADPRFWNQIQQASWRMFLFPMNAVLGSLFGGLVATFIVRGHLLDNLAASAGLGWYSLAAVLVNQLSGPEPGTVAFLANVMREVLSFMVIPFLNRIRWTPGAVALGAATTMDTTLPLFRKSGSSSAGVVYAFVNGVLVSALVPVLIPLLLKL